MPRKSAPACESEKNVFAKRLTRAMKERGENQTTLAEKITAQYVTIQRQTISLYMNGQSKPDTERLTAIAKVLDVSADWLLGLSNVKSPDADIRKFSEQTGLTDTCIDQTSKDHAIGIKARMEGIMVGDYSRIINILYGTKYGEEVLMNIDNYLNAPENTPQGRYFITESGELLDSYTHEKKQGETLYCVESGFLENVHLHGINRGLICLKHELHDSK